MEGYTPVKLAYNKHEPEGGSSEKLTPVIFLHGMTASKEHWEDIPQIVANKTKRKVYAVDARNHGDSEWSDTFNFDINAEDIHHFMKTIEENKAILVGHSMGGKTAMKAAVKYPQSIEGIVIEDMAVRKISKDSVRYLPMYLEILMNLVKDIPPELGEREAKELAMELFKKYLPKELKEYFQKVRVHDQPQSQLPIQLKRDSTGRYTHKTNLEAIWKAAQNLDALQSDMKGKYEGPAHFIYGGFSDVKVFEDSDNIKTFFPNAQFTEVKNSGHNIHSDFRDEFMEALWKSL